MSDSDVVIRVEGLGKKYALHHENSERYTALRDVVARQAKAAGRLLNPFTLAGQLRKAQREAAVERAESAEDFWALKDVSFEIRRGERVGIIGRNGAGKSTLLKILSRITEPTTGRVEIRGRVASLLEVGSGFHPELTGRENIYLNGAILGMTRREIRSKFDEIVDFAEVEKFLDTPVKRYSSGLYVRLAFAVAAHLEPEILVVDEVLAVGDARFQKKCLGKMEDVADRGGRTVLFVSHQMDAIETLCEVAIMLGNGRVVSIDSAELVISEYLSLSTENIPHLSGRRDRKGSQKAYFTRCEHQAAGVMHEGFQKSGEDLVFDLEITSRLPEVSHGIRISLDIIDDRGKTVLMFQNTFEGATISLEPGASVITVKIPAIPLAPSTYSVSLFMADNNNDILDWVQNVRSIEIVPGSFYGSGSQGLSTHCKVLARSSWSGYSIVSSSL